MTIPSGKTRKDDGRNQEKKGGPEGEKFSCPRGARIFVGADDLINDGHYSLLEADSVPTSRRCKLHEKAIAANRLGRELDQGDSGPYQERKVDASMFDPPGVQRWPRQVRKKT